MDALLTLAGGALIFVLGALYVRWLFHIEEAMKLLRRIAKQLGSDELEDKRDAKGIERDLKVNSMRQHP